MRPDAQERGGDRAERAIDYVAVDRTSGHPRAADERRFGGPATRRPWLAWKMPRSSVRWQHGRAARRPASSLLTSVANEIALTSGCSARRRAIGRRRRSTICGEAAAGAARGRTRDSAVSHNAIDVRSGRAAPGQSTIRGSRRQGNAELSAPHCAAHGSARLQWPRVPRLVSGARGLSAVAAWV